MAEKLSGLKFNVDVGKVLFLLGRLLLGIAVALLIPGLLGQYYQESARWAFYVSAAIAFGLGLFLERFFRPGDDFSFGRHEAFLLVSAAWLLATFVGALRS